MKLHASREDYLEAILMLQKKNGMVRSIDLARHMSLGREVAEKIYERHQFFTEQLVVAGVDLETAEQEACRMEHAISDTSFQKLKEKIQGTD